MFLPVLSSILGIIAFNSNFYFLAFFALIPLFIFFVKENNFWKLLVGAALFRLIFALGTVYFVVDPFLYGHSILIFLGLPISIYLLKKFLPGRDWGIYFILPFLWVLWDFLEAQHTFLPMAISVFGNILANSPFLGLARIGGVIGLTLFAATVNAIFAAAIAYRKDRACLIFLVSAAIFFIVLGLTSAKIFISQNTKDYASKTRVARVALMSVSSENKNFNDLLSTVVLPENTDLFVAPEGLYPANLENYQNAMALYSKAAKNLGVALSAITSRVDPPIGGENLYKSSIVFSKDGEIKDIYNKVNLTITSEYWSFKNWRPFYFDYYLKHLTNLEERNRAIFSSLYQYQRGEKKLLNAGNFSFAGPICLELHYPFYVKELVGLGADFILHNSNNAWVKNGINQYLRLTNNLRKIEAVWLKKPILVNGTAEYAGIIFPDGTSNLEKADTGPVIFESEVRY